MMSIYLMLWGGPSTKRLIKHKAIWRSNEFEEYIQSLDKKVARRQSVWAKSMMVPISQVIGSSRQLPMDCPDWAKISI